MSTMDLKLKSINWVGNIYQKFEAMCNEVDDIVGQDTVRYVENQVQTVGESVKKFCSNVVQNDWLEARLSVVQDILPPFVDSAKHEAQAAALKQNATHEKSMINIEGNPVNNELRQSFVEPYVTSRVSRQLNNASSLSGLHCVNELIPAPSMDPIRRADSDLSSRQSDTVLMYKNPDASVEECALGKKQSSTEMMEALSPSKKNSCESIFFRESVTEKHENSSGILGDVSSATSFDGTEFKSHQEVGFCCDKLVNETESVSDVSSSIRPSELLPSAASYKNKISEMGLTSSFTSNSLSTGSGCLSETSHKEFLQKVENSVDNPANSSGCYSGTPIPALSCHSVWNASSGNQVVETEAALSSSVVSFGSNVLDTYGTSEAESLSGSCGNRHEQQCDSIQMGGFTASLEFGHSDDFDDITDPGMVDTDLCDKVKLEDSCVIVDGSLPNASFRARKPRSYKIKIREAFTSRKKLAKEYEQLAILYGDTDVQCSQPDVQNLWPSVSITPLDSKKRPLHDLCDSEWELL
ncbi:uncharacterized protein LOC131146654 isoform X1 [Malania oleifera]|uniref:uncharacterized protein LOC131146654 isoform X1 n=1 Tax=Malania oleifera TaxID=397392 RepID=UPI0025AE80E8|nr:uncharacterized protein LOC131146654 isoform X1 [Malania oleifera]